MYPRPLPTIAYLCISQTNYKDTNLIQCIIFLVIISFSLWWLTGNKYSTSTCSIFLSNTATSFTFRSQVYNSKIVLCSHSTVQNLFKNKLIFLIQTKNICRDGNSFHNTKCTKIMHVYVYVSY